MRGNAREQVSRSHTTDPHRNCLAFYDLDQFSGLFVETMRGDAPPLPAPLYPTFPGPSAKTSDWSQQF